jgi:fructokinase
MVQSDNLVGAIEAGGTKFICAIGRGPGEGILARTSFPTGNNPTELLTQVTDWLHLEEARLGKLQAIGIASFGPLDLNMDSPTYGFITSTSKIAWQNTDFIGHMKKSFPAIPIGFDTDVNGAALGEYCWGNAQGLSDFVYITIGTGIGAGGMVGGQLIHGLIHPEMGHMVIPREREDNFKGVCPFHGDCWEGLCSGPAIKEGSGFTAETLPADNPTWEFETKYIASAIRNIICLLSPQRIILGGSVRKAGLLGEEQFFNMIREQVCLGLNGYVASPLLKDKISEYIVPPGLGDDSGICGAIALGQ